VTFNELRETYYTQAKGLVEGGVDLLLVETCQDTRNIKAAILAIHRLSKEMGSEVPFIVSVTIEPMGTMLAGQTVEAMWASLRHAKPLAFGMNCATGPEFMTRPYPHTKPTHGPSLCLVIRMRACRMKRESTSKLRRRWQHSLRNLRITAG